MINWKKNDTNRQQQTIEIELKRFELTDFSGVNYHRLKRGEKPIGWGDFEPEKQTDKTYIYNFIQNTPNEFKSLDKTDRLKMLFYYFEMKSKNNLCKKQTLREIAEYFNVKKDMIGNLIKELKEMGYIKEITEISEIDLKILKDNSTYYKLLKEDFINEKVM